MSATRLFLGAAGAITLWLILVMLWHFTFGGVRQLAHVQFLQQDFPALLIGVVGLVLLAPFAEGGTSTLPRPTARVILPIILLIALWGWAGHYLVFQDYAISRDEDVAQFAAAYMREGMLARPIPGEWIDYRRAIMPEFYSPFGADHYWAAAYLPVNSAIRALLWFVLGDSNLAGAILLAAGLIALWRIALRLFVDRPDAVWVVMLCAFVSAQLTVTAMTPYAMTGHFAFDMIWLALLLRGNVAGHLGAALVALLAGGLHQWHFPILFIAPFLLWMLVQRRWGAFLFHSLTIICLVGLWAKLWPAFLLAQLGPAADILPPSGVAHKLSSLFGRLEKWQPLFNLSRLLAWNMIGLVPLALLAVRRYNMHRRSRGAGIVFPLALGCGLSCALALFQGYGWGFRYAHGFIGSFCLLAGFGWLNVKGRSLRPVGLMVGLSLVITLFLTVRAHDYVAPYAKVERIIQSTDMDVVVVDPRGGIYATDLVRTDFSRPRHPIVLSLPMMSPQQLLDLCARHRVRFVDRRIFLPAGVPSARYGDSLQLRKLDTIADAGCER